MTTRTDRLHHILEQDLQRNRDGKLSSRQWLELITEPLSTLLLLSVPLILLVGRFGIAGRYIVLLVIASFAIMMALRAIRFSRVTLHHQVLYAEQSHPRWKFWRKLTLTTVNGDPLQFDHHVMRHLDLPQNQALMAYYLVVGDRRTLISLIPQKHPQANIAKPTALFTRRKGIIIEN